jgi:hypothetical protein
MKFARYTFLIAGVYGLVVLVPQYFLESKIGVDSPPPITHPEFLYGFIGVAIAFQIVFLIISADPIRYRLLITAAIIEKLSFAIAVGILTYLGRTSGAIVIGAAIDLLLGISFAVAWFKLAARDPN